MRFKSLLPLLALLLGVFGTIVCGVGILVVWSAGSRLVRANENAFAGIDEALGIVRGRVHNAQHRVQGLKITTDDVQQSLKNWTGKQISDQVASRLAIGTKTETLSHGLRQADLWLELSGISMQNVQQALELGSSLGVRVDANLVDPLIEKLENLRNKLSQATETVDEIHKRVADIVEGQPRETKMEQAAEFALRTLVMLGEIDSRLGESADWLSKTQIEGRQIKSRTHAYIIASQIAVILLIAWMAIGQVCLSQVGWMSNRGSRSAGWKN